jgi:isopenicillin-N epimerase
VPEAIRVIGGMVPGGWPEVMRRNHELAVQARRILCPSLGVEPPCPEEMLGSMSAVILPRGLDRGPAGKNGLDPLHELLAGQYFIEPVIFAWGDPMKKILRVSAQLYNTEAQYILLGEVLRKIAEGTGG